MENKFGLMDHHTKESGLITKDVERESMFVMMATHIREIFKMINSMGTEYIEIERGTSTEGTGKTTREMERERSTTITNFSLRDIINKVKRTEEENTYGLMATNTMESGRTIIYQGMECILFMMGERILANGRIIFEMVKVFLHGLMEPDTRASTRTI